MSYFTRKEAEKFAFIQIPKTLFTGEKYKDMSSDARILYGVLLDRHKLSIENNWVDEQGRVYIFFAREKIQEYLNFGNQKVAKLFKELSRLDLVEEKRQGVHKHNIIYVKKFIEENTPQTQSNQLKCENHISRDVKITFQEMLKSHANKTKYNNTKENKSVSQSKKEGAKNEKQPTRTMTDGRTEFRTIKFYFKDKLYLDDLRTTNSLNTTLIDEIELNILEMYFNEYTTIKGERKSQEIVRSALMRLNHWHIEELISKYKSLTVKIRNPKAYIQTMIYNIAFENDLSVTNAVQHDMNSFN